MAKGASLGTSTVVEGTQFTITGFEFTGAKKEGTFAILRKTAASLDLLSLYPNFLSLCEAAQEAAVFGLKTALGSAFRTAESFAQGVDRLADRVVAIEGGEWGAAGGGESTSVPFTASSQLAKAYAEASGKPAADCASKLSSFIAAAKWAEALAEDDDKIREKKKRALRDACVAKVLAKDAEIRAVYDRMSAEAAAAREARKRAKDAEKEVDGISVDL